MNFLDFTHGKGALEENFDLKSVLKRVKDDKFMQRQLVDLDDETIKRVITSKKYMIGEALIEDSVTDLNFEFGTINKDKGYEFYSDLCAKNLIFYVIKNVVDDKEILELCATTTLVNEGGGISTSLYYIPKGDFSNVCMIARVCHHQGTNDHKNSDGTMIDRNAFHMHVQSEKYIGFVKEKYKNNPEKLILSIQSPDAFVLKRECKNVRQLADVATDIFGITQSTITVMTDKKANLYHEMKHAVNEMSM